jgi:PPK2 family polyphosphate:nucleotide phosphotransferase
MKYSELFGVKPGSSVRLAEIDPGFTDDQEDKKSAADEVAGDLELLCRLQYLLYAEHKRSLLIILQGVDASGKDGTVSHVFSGINPQGAYVHSFKEPTREELDHDFLWRVHRQTPAKGQLAIFNRSQYEDVLVVRVHNLVPEDVWQKRYGLINDFEKNLALAGTTILKFFLYISEGEQLKRFKDRLDDPERRWKISEADYTERAYFGEYITAYEEVLNKTSTDYAPWFIIPADHKWFRNLAVSKIVVETLESLHMSTPPPSVDIDKIRKEYHDAKKDEKKASK